jgi:hypothetical protein
MHDVLDEVLVAVLVDGLTHARQNLELADVDVLFPARIAGWDS